MKMPEKIESAMFAPCGMDCMVCYKHCYHKKPCAGCLKSDQALEKAHWELFILIETFELSERYET